MKVLKTKQVKGDTRLTPMEAVVGSYYDAANERWIVLVLDDNRATEASTP
jgi:hypothetical protein